MRVLVTGGAGYIGSIVLERLAEIGHEAVALDNLKYGNREAVHPGARLIECDLSDAERLCSLLTELRPDAALHLAAEAYIDDSIRDPGLFFEVNTAGTLNLLRAMVSAGCRRLVFSSTAAVYGEPVVIPIAEDHPCDPVNSYGESKLQAERMMPWFQHADGLGWIALRYFNACGATERYGEARRKETHIIPLLFDVAAGKRDVFTLFGTDYDTEDGTCVRDYVHVSDIADAHLLALAATEAPVGAAYNIGSGHGYSNLQVIETVREVTGVAIQVRHGDRRPGDPAKLVASHDKIARELGWRPKHRDLNGMVESAWRWRLAHPSGYPQ